MNAKWVESLIAPAILLILGTIMTLASKFMASKIDELKEHNTKEHGTVAGKLDVLISSVEDLKGKYKKIDRRTRATAQMSKKAMELSERALLVAEGRENDHDQS